MSLTPQLCTPAIRDSLIARARRLRPDSARAWGRMTPHQMVWHVTSAFQHGFGELVLPDVSTWFTRRILRVVAFHTPMQWPKGAPTSPPLDARKNPSPATSFEEDLRRLCDYITRFADAQVDGTRHVIFGPMTQDEWQHWGWRHTDHHFRQFNV